MPKDPNVNLMPQHNCQIICVAYYIAPWQWGLNHFYLFYFVEKNIFKVLRIHLQYPYILWKSYRPGWTMKLMKHNNNFNVNYSLTIRYFPDCLLETRNSISGCFVHHWIHLQHILAAMMLIKEVFLKRLGISPHSFLATALKCNVRNKLKNS